MTEISDQQLIRQLNWRYAVKQFDPQRTIDDPTWQALEQSLILTPSSYGLQPWKFFVITDPQTKSKLTEISWNQRQPQDCSHMVVCAARRTMDADYVDQYMQLVTDRRGLPAGTMDGYRRVLVSTIEKMDSHLDWNARQVYIALGQLMVAAAMLGIDTCPMEGIDAQAYDQLLELSDTDYTTVVGCAVGYRAATDAQSKAAKVRFDASDLVVHI